MTTTPKPADEQSDEELRDTFHSASTRDDATWTAICRGNRAVYNAGRASRDGELLQAVAEIGTWKANCERLSEGLARLRAALESAQSDRQRAVDDLFAQLRENERLRAESMRGAVELLRERATHLRRAGDYARGDSRPHVATVHDDRADAFEDCADWLEQQSATPQPVVHRVETYVDATGNVFVQPDPEHQPTECRAVQTARMRAESRDKVKP